MPPYISICWGMPSWKVVQQKRAWGSLRRPIVSWAALGKVLSETEGGDPCPLLVRSTLEHWVQSCSEAYYLQNVPGHGSGYPALGVPAGERVVADGPRGSFPQLFCDFMSNGSMQRE